MKERKGKSKLLDKNEKETMHSQLISSIPLLTRDGEVKYLYINP
jgi:hypothetical protein